MQQGRSAVGRVKVSLVPVVFVCAWAHSLQLVFGNNGIVEGVVLSEFQLHGAAQAAWESAEALGRSRGPGVAITEPAHGAAAISLCEHGYGSATLRWQVLQGDFPEDLKPHLSDVAGSMTIVLNGQTLNQSLTIFRRCVTDSPDVLLPAHCGVNPDSLFLWNSYVAVLHLPDLICGQEHSIVVNAEMEVHMTGAIEAGLASPLQVQEISAETTFSLVDASVLHRPKPRAFPVRQFPPYMHFETHAEITSDVRLFEGGVPRNDFFGFARDFEVLHCLFRRYANSRQLPHVAKLIEIGTNDGYGLLIIDAAVRGHTNPASSSSPKLSIQPKASEGVKNGWRLITLDLPQCSDSDNDDASKSVCVKGDFSKRSKEVGSRARDGGVVYQQVWGDSMHYNFEQHGPIEVKSLARKLFTYCFHLFAAGLHASVSR